MLYVGTSARDVEQYDYLTRSIHRHNRDALKIYTAVNDDDLELFRARFSDRGITFVKDSDIYPTDSTRVDGWKKQQIIKMNFHRLGVCENFVQIDSDSFFIRDFYAEDFMFDGETPYTLAHENKELSEFFAEHNAGGLNRAVSPTEFYTDIPFRQTSEKIRRLFSREHRRFLDGGHPPCIWSTKVWRLLEEYARDKKMSYEDLILYAPSEQQWYVELLLEFRLFALIPIQPMFKVFHYHRNYTEFLARHHDNVAKGIDDLKYNYWGIGLQSSFSASFFRQSAVYKHWFPF